MKAQTQETVVINTPEGGDVTPTPGSYTYASGTNVTFTESAGDGFIWSEWQVATDAGAVVYTDTSITLNITSDTEVSAIFTPIQSIPPATLTGTTALTNAIIVVVAGVGGTTTPAPGTYALSNAATTDLTAIPDSGWTFDHWVIAGYPLTHGVYAFTDTPTENPYNVNHGYGETYTYEAVFSPTSTSTSPTPTVNEFSSATAIIIAAILALVAFGTYTYTRRAKK